VLQRIFVSTLEVAAWYGMGADETEAILRELETLGTLVSIHDAEAAEGEDSASSSLTCSPSHPFTPAPPRSPARWASPEHLEGAYIATLARRRREARPASLAQYQRFLLAWQHRTGSPLAGEEGVAAVLAQLQGLPLPATVWEGELLARRVRAYQPGWLDRACETGEFVWQGSAGSFSGRGRVAFFQRELFPFWPRAAIGSADLPVGERLVGVTMPSGLSVTSRVAEMLEQRGASFLIDLAMATGIDSRDVAAALWELIWQGAVTHDRWSVIRAGEPVGRRAASPVRSAVPSRLSSHSSARWPRPALRGRGVSLSGGSAGRYSWLHSLRAQSTQPFGESRSEGADLVARQMLERYGVVARELLQMEAVPLPWGALYDALNGMELTGEIHRGYFVEGFSGAQFGLPRACDELKALQERRGAAAPEYVLLNTCDPANLYGAAIRGSANGDGDVEGEDAATGDREEAAGAVSSASHRASILRLPGNYMVLQDGAPALLLESGARRLSPLLPLAGEELDAACAALRELTEHPWPLRPIRQLRIERWGDRPIRGSEAETPLRALGFSLSPKGLEL
jgi:ATP-dependent helicase Lhr and Lhr-like helicase